MERPPSGNHTYRLRAKCKTSIYTDTDTDKSHTDMSREVE